MAVMHGFGSRIQSPILMQHLNRIQQLLQIFHSLIFLQPGIALDEIADATRHNCTLFGCFEVRASRLNPILLEKIEALVVGDHLAPVKRIDQ
jgi:hypothetical protein